MKITNVTQFKQLKRCVRIEGSLTFTSFTYNNISFPNLLYIGDYLKIHKIDNLFSVKQLLPNLAHIRTPDYLIVDDLIITKNRDLEKLEFKKLLKIFNGFVKIKDNPRLCLSDIISWMKIQEDRPVANTIKIRNLRIKNFGFFNVFSFQILRNDCPGCPHNKMLFGSECVETCPKNSLNLMNRQCISTESCEKENSEYWKGFKFISSNGSCKLIRYCDSIEINENSDSSALSLLRGCQVIQGFVDIRFSRNLCNNMLLFDAAIQILSEIEEIRDYLKIANSSRIKNLGFLPKLKMINGVKLESGTNSLVLESKIELESLLVTSQNYTINSEPFCRENCVSKSGKLTLEITAKTYGFLAKIMNEDLKNILDDNMRLVFNLREQDFYHQFQICEFRLLSIEWVKFWIIKILIDWNKNNCRQFLQETLGTETKIYVLKPGTSYVFKLYAVDTLERIEFSASGYNMVETLSTFIHGVSFTSEPDSLVSLRWNYLITKHANFNGYTLKTKKMIFIIFQLIQKNVEKGWKNYFVLKHFCQKNSHSIYLQPNLIVFSLKSTSEDTSLQFAAFE